MIVSLLIISLFLAASLQSLTGIGFSLIAMPIAVLLLGADLGVLLVNLVGMAVCFNTWYLLRNHGDNRLTRTWVLMGAIGLVPAFYVQNAISEDLLNVIIGAVTLTMLLVSSFSVTSAIFGNNIGRKVAGSVAGFMTYIAALPGPLLASYALAARMKHKTFVATAQPVFLFLGAVSGVIKYQFAGISGFPFRNLAWIYFIVAVLAGTYVGNFFLNKISERITRRMVYWVTFGACVMLIFNSV